MEVCIHLKVREGRRVSDVERILKKSNKKATRKIVLGEKVK